MAYSFTASSSQYLSVSTTPYDTEPFTFAARAYANDTATLYSILGIADNSAYYWLAFRGDNAGDPIMAQKFNSTSATASGGTFAANTWVHAGGVFESSTSRSVYVDGSKTSNTTNLASVSSTKNFTIGNLRLGTTNFNFLNGRAAEVAIWSVALTDAEITSLSKGFKPSRIRPQSLVFYAPLIRNLQDIKGARALTNNGSATVTDHPRVY